MFWFALANQSTGNHIASSGDGPDCPHTKETVQAIPPGVCRVGESCQLAQLDRKHLEVIK